MSSRSAVAGLLRTLVSFIYHNTDLMLLQSPAFVENLKGLGYEGRYDVLYNWAPDQKEQNNDPEWLMNFPMEKFTLTFAGNVGRAQGLDRVLLAASELSLEVPELQIVIVGEGSFLEDLKKICLDLNLSNVTFYPRQKVEDMDVLFRKSSALLVSLTDQEMFQNVIPSKIQAYMSAGKPIVAFLNGVGADLIKEVGCGFSAKAGDVEEFARQVKQLIAMGSDEREQMGRRGRNFFCANFDRKIAMDRLEKFFESVVDNK